MDSAMRLAMGQSMVTAAIADAETGTERIHILTGIGVGLALGVMLTTDEQASLSAWILANTADALVGQEEGIEEVVGKIRELGLEFDQLATFGPEGLRG